MPYTQADVDALRETIKQYGYVRSLTLGDRRTDFASLDEMQQLLATMEREVAAQTTAPRPRQYRITGSKGL